MTRFPSQCLFVVVCAGLVLRDTLRHQMVKVGPCKKKKSKYAKGN